MFNPVGESTTARSQLNKNETKSPKAAWKKASLVFRHFTDYYYPTLR